MQIIEYAQRSFIFIFIRGLRRIVQPLVHINVNVIKRKEVP